MASQPEEIYDHGQEPQPQPILAPGDRVEHFEVVRLIGRGGMGEVYLARDTRLSRKVALKIVKPKAFGDQGALERFLYEAKVTARFNHPHIVTAYHVGDHQGNPYVALEYLEGQTLRERMNAGRIGVAECLEIGRAIAGALAEAHRHKILHRDLKPENVVLPPDGRLRVLDFGLARVVVAPDLAMASTLADSTTLSGDSLIRQLSGGHDQGFTGTPFYMAPEQWQSEPSTGATDVWGLGVILFEMLSGQRPFQGNTVFLLGSRIIGSDPAPELPRLLSPTEDAYWPELSSLVARCLSKAPDARPSAEQVATELRRLHDQGPATQAPARIAARRLLWPALLGAALGLLALAGLTAAVLGWGRPHDPPRPLDRGAERAGVEERAGASVVFGPRMASARSVVRLGTTELPYILGSEVAPAVFWGLLHTDAHGEAVPVLVAEQPTEANGGARPAPGGGFEVTWRLRHGLRWSDGRPLTASDLAFGLEVRGDPRVIEVRVPDQATLVVRWDDQVAAALDSVRPLPRHVLGRAFAEAGERGAEVVNELLRTRPTPVIGPYRVVEFAAGERLVLEANPHFVGAPPAIGRVEVVCAAPDELVRRFDAGQLDLILPDSITLAQAQGLLARHAEAVHIRPSRAQLVLHPDLAHPLLSSTPARQALLRAIDRRALVAAVYGGEGQLAHAPTNGELPAGVEVYDFDRDAARAALAPLLASAGAELTLFHGDGEAERQVAELVAADLAAVGLAVTRREVDAAEQRRLFRAAHHGGLLLYTLTVASWQSVLPHLNLPRTASGFDLTARTSGFDERMAALVAQEQAAVIPERQAQVRASLWVRYSQLLPTLPLAFAAERLVVDPSLRGWEVPPGDRFGRGLEGWYFVRTPAGRVAPDLTEALED